MRLSYAQHEALKKLSRGYQPGSITNRTCAALAKFGLVEWISDQEAAWGGKWALTAAGWSMT